jgi:Icc-related predicted phosphoesterase
LSMRIAAVSDLHVLPTASDDALLTAIRRRVEEIRPQVFVVAGDISDKLDVLAKALKILHVNGCHNLYVAGNHDIWFEEKGGPGSLEKYSEKIGEACVGSGFHHIPDAPVVIEGVGFVGSIGWYDYSFRREDMNIPLESYEGKEYKGAVWYDLFRVDWRFTDREATELFNRRLEYDIRSLPEGVERIVYVSHHLPFRELTVYKNRFPWDFHSAFMGATSTGDILTKGQRVVLSISGHSHIRTVARIGGITAVTVPLGYGRPDACTLSEFAHKAVADIHLEGTKVMLPGFVEGDICEGLEYVSSRE